MFKRFVNVIFQGAYEENFNPIFCGSYGHCLVLLQEPFCINYLKYYAWDSQERAPKAYLNDLSMEKFFHKDYDWMRAQIDSDLEPFGIISQDMLDHAHKVYGTKENRLLRVRIINNKVYVHRDIKHLTKDGWRFLRNTRYMLNLFKDMASQGLIPDVDFILVVQDYVLDHPEEPSLAPLIVFARDNSREEEKHFILMPDWMNIRFSYKGGPHYFDQYGKMCDWDQKKSQMLFRGGLADSTGFRHAIVDYARTHPFVDAKFTQGPDTENNFMSVDAQMSYRYQLSIDGATATWSRVLWILATNTLLLKQDSRKVQWFYGALKPYEHFVPISMDLDKLPATYSWLQNNQGQAKEMVQKGRAFYKKNLKYESMVVVRPLELGPEISS